MAGRVLTDASPLIGLARVDGLSWLGALFGSVWVPALLLMNERAARSVFARLHASDFRISAQVIATILRRVGE